MLEPKALRTGTRAGAFFGIPIYILRLDQVVDFDLYLQTREDHEPILYREKGLPFNEENLTRLQEHGTEEVFVKVGQAKSLHRYVERNLGQIVADPRVSVEDKSAVVYDTLVWLIDDALADPRATDLVQRGNRAAKNTATFFYQNKSALKCLMQVSVFDYSTYTHSVNVFIFSVALGQRIFPEEYVSNDFGLGALLHDVGKSMVPPEILNCRGKLSHSQFEIMKKHTVYGYDILIKNGEAPKIALTMARHHHERFLGGGYPDNLKGEEIPREVRVLTIADIFDALTTERSYKASMHSFPALKLMQNEMRGHMDPELFQIFIGMMGNPTYEE